MKTSNGMKILVTGGAGFVGSHLCKRLADLGHTVISLDNYFTGSRENHIAGVDYREGHTKDIAKYIKEQVDIIYHLGEYSRLEISFSEPEIVWDLNIAGTFGVLDFWRKQNIEQKKKCKLIYAGSSSKFSDDDTGKNKGADESPYAWTKASNAELIKNYASWYGLPFANTYFYNVYGEGERGGKYGTLIEIFKQQYLKGQPLTVVAPGTQKRVFTHVLDIVDGLILVGAKGKKTQGDLFGLGADKAYSVLDITKLFNAPIKMFPERQGNRLSYKLNIEKSQMLGWRATHSIEDYILEVKNYRG